MAQTTEKDLLKLLQDDRFDKIEFELNKPNFFSILKIGRKEIRHSNFLGWLLDPNENHGLGDFLLKPFLREIFSEQKAVELSLMDAEINDFKNIQVRREWKNIDILIILRDIVICVENKIGNQDHRNQLKTYKEVVESKFPDKRHSFVYLTPFGHSPSEQKESYINYSYGQISKPLKRLLNKENVFIDPRINIYIKDYLSILNKQVMKEDPVNELASKLYLHHKETLDFIFNNRPDAVDDFKSLIKNKIKIQGWKLLKADKKYIRFTTTKIEKHLPQGSKKAWKGNEIFLFEIVKPDSNSDDIFFKGTIVSGDDNNREKLHNLLNGLKIGNHIEFGSIYLSHIRYKFGFSFNDFKKYSISERDSKVKFAWHVINDRVTTVENMIIKEFTKD